jgi:hypothetical protein
MPFALASALKESMWCFFNAVTAVVFKSFFLGSPDLKKDLMVSKIPSVAKLE